MDHVAADITNPDPVTREHDAPLLTGFSLQVQRMTCASCVARVEKALARVPGVAQSTVNVATARADVRADPSRVSARHLVEAIRTAGYDVEPASLSLDVSGLTCASCVSRVEKALGQVPGVLTASVNLANGRARVETAGEVPVQVLIDAGSPVDVPDKHGHTPLALAVKACVDSYWKERRSPDSVRALLAAGASAKQIALPTGYTEIDVLLQAAG